MFWYLIYRFEIYKFLGSYFDIYFYSREERWNKRGFDTFSIVDDFRFISAYKYRFMLLLKAVTTLLFGLFLELEIFFFIISWDRCKGRNIYKCDFTFLYGICLSFNFLLTD